MTTASANSGTQPEPATEGVEYGQETLETADSAEAIFSQSQETTSVIIRALPGNSGNLFWGWDADVDSSNAFPIEAGDSVTIDIDVSSQNVFVAAATGGDVVAFSSMR